MKRVGKWLDLPFWGKETRWQTRSRELSGLFEWQKTGKSHGIAAEAIPWASISTASPGRETVHTPPIWNPVDISKTGRQPQANELVILRRCLTPLLICTAPFSRGVLDHLQAVSRVLALFHCTQNESK